MVRAGHEVHLITSHNYKTFHLVNIEGIRVYYLPLKYKQEFSPFKKVQAYCRFAYEAHKEARKIKGADLVYATSTPLTVGVIALLLRKMNGSEYLFEVRDIWPEVPIALGVIKNGLLKKILYGVTRAIYENASAIISLSPGITEEIRKYKTQTPIYELSNFADTGLFRPMPAKDDLKKTYLTQREIGIVHFGAVGRVNHLDYFWTQRKQAKE